MVNEYPEKIDSKGEYSDWVSILAENVIENLKSAGDLSNITDSRIESAVRKEVHEKIGQLSHSHTPKNVLKFSDTLQGTFIQGRMRNAKDTDEESADMARVALYESVLEEVRFEIERLSD